MFVGRAGIEAEILDSMTNERLAAGIERRAGAETIKGAFGKWTQVKQAMDAVAGRLTEGLAEYRDGYNK